jgi:hypothetical protein
MQFREVSREECLAFIKAYPRKLEFDCTGICEPPVGTYNDFAIAPEWPGSIVAKESRSWLGPGGAVDNASPGKFWKYYIRTDIPEPAEKAGE